MKILKFLPFLILGISIVITFAVWINFLTSQTALEETKFISNSNFVKNSIVDRIAQYEQILYGARGLFVSSQHVEFNEWKSFVASQNIDERFRGIQGVGVIVHITNDEEMNQLINEMHGYDQDFSISPTGKRNEYYVTKYLEPVDFRNKRAIGYDIFSENTRRTAVESALSTGQITLTGKITLVQETETDVQNGFLMLLPICDAISNTCNNDDLVYAVFRMNDFVNGILNKEQFRFTHLRIYDDSIGESNLTFDSDDLNKHEFSKPDFSEFYNVSVGNRDWIFAFESIAQVDYSQNLVLILIPLIGFSMGLMLFYVFYLINKNLKLTQDAIKNEKIALIGTMASRISHDLRNPLSVVRLNVDLLHSQLGSLLDEKSNNRFSMIKKALDGIAKIISDVLEFSRNKELNCENTSLLQMLNNIISQLILPDTVKINLPKNDVNIFCDRSKLESVLMNLVKNSLDALDNKGTITISAEKESQTTSIIIEDSGPGIKNEHLETLFDPLFTTKIGGTGLGLPICKSIVEQHNGQILVKNNPTRFILVLPNN